MRDRKEGRERNMSGMSRGGRRGRREDNILVFGRKLKIVEIFSADVVGSSLPSSHDVFLFFSLSASVNLLILFPDMQSLYRRIAAKGIRKSIHLLKNIPQGQTWTVQQERETFTLTQHPAGQYIDKRINRRSLSHFASSKHGSFDLGLQ